MWDQNYAQSELPSDEENTEEIEFISRVLDLKEGSMILDLCCGQGRHSLALASMGYRVIGLDSSEVLLNIARKSVDSSPDSKIYSSNVCFIQGDMKCIPLRENTFDAVINIFSSFGFFDDKGNMEVLKYVYAVLKPGGKFLLDYWNPYAAAQLDGTRNWWWITDRLLALAEAQYEFSTGRLRDLRTIIDVEKSTIENATREIMFYMLPQLKEMLENAGLHIVEVYGDIDEREYNGDSRRLITLSHK